MNPNQAINDFDLEKRTAALDLLMRGAETVPTADAVNLHCHTFFSYNGYGLSPTAVAWEAYRRGLAAVGIVDFDVVDAADEFRAACRRLGIRGIAGIETRIFIPEFADKVINSPGEPGIAYHMGTGFVSCASADASMIDRLKGIAQDRNKGIIDRVNPVLDPVAVSYEEDLLPLAPKGNPTERHLCAAYASKAEDRFPDANARADFWSRALGVNANETQAIIGDHAKLEALIRAKTMKRGGAGYVDPDAKSFPTLTEFNDFVKAAGAIPTCAWLDGTTDGEQDMERLLEIEMGAGVEAINIIPDRNWNIADPEVKKQKVHELNRIIAIAQERDLPMLVGTEMNAPGQRYVDDFSAPELAPHVPAFLEGAYVVYGHTIMQEAADLGYTSGWAASHFDSRFAKNSFYAAVGRAHDPAAPAPREIPSDAAPDGVLAAIAAHAS